MNGLNFLVETTENVEVLSEQTANGKQMFIEGIFAQAEVVNGNKRFYPQQVMERSIDKYINEYVNKNRALGELKHPDYPMPDPEHAAIRITELNMDGNNVYGKAIVLNTPKGQTVRGLLEGGFAMGVSTRALGSLKEQGGIKYVQDNLMYTAVDCVDNPSAPDAYVNHIMESQVWSINESGVWVPQVEAGESDYVNEQLFLERLEQFVKSVKHRK